MSPPDEETKKVKVFHLDRFSQQWEEYVTRNRNHKAEKAFLDEVSDLFKELAKGNDQLWIGNREVGKIVAGQLNMTSLREEQPEIVEEFTEVVTTTEFNKIAFQKKYPKLYAAYQAKRLVVDPALMGPKNK